MKKFYSPSIAATTAAFFGSISGNAVLTSAVPAYTAELYHDLPLTVVENSTISSFVPALDGLFFIHDTQLWSLGADGVSTVNDMKMPWSNFGEGEMSTAIMDGRLYFFAGDDESSLRLWKTDGTEAGTFRVKDLNSAASNGVTLTSLMGAPQIVAVNQRVYFYDLDESGLPRLFSSDGTAAGTQLVEDGSDSQLPASTTISHITEYDGKIYFPAEGQICETVNGTTTCEDGQALFVLEDGQPARQAVNLTSPLATLGDTKMIVFNNNLFFQTEDGGIIRTDGTQDGTISFPLEGSHFTSAVDGLFFFCSDIGSIHEKSICKSDGTESGTSYIANLTSSVGFSKGMTPLGDKILFHNRKRRNGVIKPHVLDPAATRNNVKTLADLDTTDVYSNYVLYDDYAFFKAAQSEGDGTLGMELYVTDGTQDGTVLVKDINPGTLGSNIRSLGVFQENLYFTAYTPDSGYDIWKVTGCPEEGCPMQPTTPPTPTTAAVPISASTPAPTKQPSPAPSQAPTFATPNYTAEMYHDLPLAVENSTQSGFVPALDRLFFIHGTKLWALDTNGVSLLNENDMGWSNLGESEASTAVMDGVMYFFAGEDEDNFDLWKTDGTEAGTVVATELSTVSSNGVTLSSLIGAPQIVAVGEDLYLYNLDESGLPRLYKSDGTEEGTQLVEGGSDSPLPKSTAISYITEYNGEIYFPADGQVCKTINGTVTCEDGKALFVVEDGLARQAVDVPSQLATETEDTKMMVYNDFLFFQTVDEGLFRTDGTQDGTISFPMDGSHFAATEDGLYFTCSEIEPDIHHKKSICRTDGTVNGTSYVANLTSAVGFSKGLTPLGDKILFHNRKKRNDVIKPHVLDPTATRKNVDILADLDTTDVYSNFIVYNEHAFFKAEQADESNATLGLELYVTDGTEDGTVLVKDINPGTLGSNIRSFGILQDNLYFIAYTVDSGYDVWKVVECPDEGCLTPKPTATLTPAPTPKGTSFTAPTPGDGVGSEGTPGGKLPAVDIKPAPASSGLTAMMLGFQFFVQVLLGYAASLAIII